MTCRICGSNQEPIDVHGHTQCGRCGSLQEGCCEGAGNCLEEPPPPRKESTANDRIQEHHNDDLLKEGETT